MAPQVQIDSGWSDLVFHVLAHVDLAGAVPSLFLFASMEQAQAAAECELNELTDVEVASPNAQRELAPALPAAELLRCAALLDAPWHASLPEARTDQSELESALARVAACAPKLAEVERVFCRALTRHGRVFGERIFLGLPDPEIGVSVEQVAFQAGHEASVLEVSRGMRLRSFRLGERVVEAAAVVLFAQRCARAGLAAEHAAWGEQWGLRPEHCAVTSLSEPGSVLVNELLRQ
jgi:hypothetical protein